MPIIRSITDIKKQIAECQLTEDPCVCLDNDETFLSLGHLLDHLHMENKSACKRSVCAVLADAVETATRRCQALSYLVLRTQMKGTEGAKIFAEYFTAEKINTLESLTQDDRGVAITLWSGYMLMYSQNVLPSAYEPNAALFIARNYLILAPRLTSLGDSRTLCGGLGVLLLILMRNDRAKELVLSSYTIESCLWTHVRSLNHPTLTRYMDQLCL